MRLFLNLHLLCFLPFLCSLQAGKRMIMLQSWQTISWPDNVSKDTCMYPRNAWDRYARESKVANPSRHPGRVILYHHGRGIELPQPPGDTPPDDEAAMELCRLSNVLRSARVGVYILMCRKTFPSRRPQRPRHERNIQYHTCKSTTLDTHAKACQQTKQTYRRHQLGSTLQMYILNYISMLALPL